MACYQFEVEFLAIKGLGPDSIIKTISIGIDDVEDDVPEAIVRDWAINDARAEMRQRGYTIFTLREVYRS